jgi:transposase
MYQHTIGIDVSKDSLDMRTFPSGESETLKNDPKGWRAAVKLAARREGTLVVFEPTGAYHRGLEAALAKAGIAYAKVNPRHVKRFGDALGSRAKTDQEDAGLLARFGAVLQPEPTTPTSETLLELRELHTVRAGLVKDRTTAMIRRKTAVSPLVKKQIEKRLRQVEADMEAIDLRIGLLVSKEEELSRRSAILTTIPGVATRSAYAMLIEMPELGTIDGKAAASLAGLAPMTRQSGKWKGKAFIRGGRAMLRRSLYMPAVAAIRFNPDLKLKYAAMRAAGKPPKLALTAIMRKLVVLANALLRQNRSWSPRTA